MNKLFLILGLLFSFSSLAGNLSTGGGAEQLSFGNYTFPTDTNASSSSSRFRVLYGNASGGLEVTLAAGTTSGSICYVVPLGKTFRLIGITAYSSVASSIYKIGYQSEATTTDGTQPDCTGDTAGYLGHVQTYPESGSNLTTHFDLQVSLAGTYTSRELTGPHWRIPAGERVLIRIISAGGAHTFRVTGIEE